MSTTKIKVHKTNRILLHSAVIYCSCDIVREVSNHLIRVNQRLAPKKGESVQLKEKLRSLARDPKYSNHFPQSAKNILES